MNRASADSLVCCIAGCQPATFRISRRSHGWQRSADWQSAIRQVGNLNPRLAAESMRSVAERRLNDLPPALLASSRRFLSPIGGEDKGEGATGRSTAHAARNLDPAL